MARYILARISFFGLVILGATFVVFLVLHGLADPARIALPIGSTDAEVASFRDQMGLSDPFLVQYFRFITNAMQGDFNNSLWLGGSNIDIVLDRIPVTLVLALVAIGIAGIVGVFLGMLAALRAGTWIDDLISGIGYALMSISDVWLSLVLILIFAVNLHWFATSGFGLDPRLVVLPVLALALRPVGQVTQVTRSAMLNVSKQEYAILARAKGMPPTRVAFVHLLKNAAPPILTFLVYEMGRLFAGTAVVVESIFAWPGVGSLAVGALERGDIFLIQTLVVVVAVIVATLNLLADVLHMTLDRRIVRQR